MAMRHCQVRTFLSLANILETVSKIVLDTYCYLLIVAEPWRCSLVEDIYTAEEFKE